jgi:phenylalanyl-tRNA synthetase beta chain
VRTLSRYPAVQRDLAAILSEQHSHGEIEDAVRQAAGPLLDRVALFDVYRGAPVPAGHRSLAYSLTFRAPDRTLAEDEVGSAMQAVEQALITQFGGQIRGR